MEDFPITSLKSIITLFNIPPQLRTQSDLESIMNITRDNKFLKKISQEKNSDRIHWESCRVMTLEVYQRNEKIINFGEIGDRFYIIIKGKVSIIVPTKSQRRNNSTKYDLMRGLSKLNASSSNTDKELTVNDKIVFEEIRKIERKKTQIDFNYLNNFGEIEEGKEVNTLTNGDSFGELSLITKKPRTATIIAKDISYLAVIFKRDFEKILASDAMNSLEERINLLKQISFFASFPKVSLQKFSYALIETTFKKDQVIYDESSAVTSFFLIKNGEFQITQGEIITKDRYENNDVFLKLSMMKKSVKKINLKTVVKGKNEIFGYEEIADGKNVRTKKCVCISKYAQVYEVKIEVIFK